MTDRLPEILYRHELDRARIGFLKASESNQLCDDLTTEISQLKASLAVLRDEHFALRSRYYRVVNSRLFLLVTKIRQLFELPKKTMKLTNRPKTSAPSVKLQSDSTTFDELNSPVPSLDTETQILANAESAVSSEEKFEIYHNGFLQLRDIKPDAAYRLELKAWELAKTYHVARNLAYISFRNGNLSEAKQFADIWLDANQEPLTVQNNRWLSDLRAWQSLKAGFPLPLVDSSLLKTERTSQKVLMCLHKSLPFSTAGYCTRTQWLLKNLKQLGTVIVPTTRLGYPFDDVADTAEGHDDAVVDGIRYSRLRSFGIGFGKLTPDEYMRHYGTALVKKIVEEKIDIVHAVSNFTNALPAISAAKLTGRKSIYEIRGLWELTKGSNEPFWMNSEHFNIQRSLEIQAAQAADYVITITDALKGLLVEHGVKEEKIFLAPNGTDLERFTPRPKNLSLKAKLGIPQDVPIVGFVGSFVSYEGLDDLVRAHKQLQQEGVSSHLLLVGSGPAFDETEQLIDNLSLNSSVTLVGRIPHEEVPDYYSIIDIAPFPRKSVPVCEIVSPLKPFEAMAMGVAVIVSSVGAMKEFALPGKNAEVFAKGDRLDLVAKLRDLLASEEKRLQLSQSAKAWVAENRTWEGAAEVIQSVYAKASE